MTQQALRGLPSDAQVVSLKRVKEKIIPQYQVPKVEIGWNVTWYPDADVTLGNGHRAQVAKVEGDVVSLFVFANDGLRKCNSVRHISDPKAGSPNLKRYGAWDYADTRELEYCKRLERENESLKLRIEMLETNVAAMLNVTPEEYAADVDKAIAASNEDPNDAEEPEAEDEGGGLVSPLIEETDDDDSSK